MTLGGANTALACAVCGQVCGIQAPSMGRTIAADAAPAADSANGAPPTAAALAAMPATSQANAEPYAREAKFLTESRALNRCVATSHLMNTPAALGPETDT